MRGITPKEIRGHIDRRLSEDVGNATVNRELALLSAAINFYNQEYLDSPPNPTKGRKLREPESRVRYLTEEEAGRLIGAARSGFRSSHLADFIILALNTGCRSSEMLELEWARVNLKERLVFLEAQHTKAARRRSIPLNDDAYRALLSRANFRATHCPDSPRVFRNEQGEQIKSVKRSFATACTKAKITNFRIHDLRHTCAAWLVSAEVPLPEVRDLLGHSTIMMTERYAHLAPDNVRRAVEAIKGKVTF